MEPSTDISLADLAKLEITHSIPEDVLQKALSTQPFIGVPGAINIRDLGVLGAPYIRPGLVYRSGMLGHLTDEGKAQLYNDMGVRLILDLRSDGERTTSPPPQIPGIKIAWVPSEKAQTPADLNVFAGENGGEVGYRQIYLDMLDVYAPSYQYVLEYLRDEAGDGKGVLFHCSGKWGFSYHSYLSGKDRTGVLSAILLGLAGASDAAIAADYTLTRIGIEPRKSLFHQALLNWRPEWSVDAPGWTQFSNIKASYMLGFLDAMRDTYGGVEGYVRSHLGFSEEDIKKIQVALRQ
ncbi:hypothetical protein FE257_007712 [Aspergillus nanangensis]|uniref:Tyrosine specific protein phosphatases domain-containing protein n=1 Tax=Aspergillus nanangensis TaxID=2582783 RepID=A0AAD4CWV7_ASPNN|nr:hypothetical protein FE257_007712 [Aspergillus nanangensis]